MAGQHHRLTERTVAGCGRDPSGPGGFAYTHRSANADNEPDANRDPDHGAHRDSSGGADTHSDPNRTAYRSTDGGSDGHADGDTHTGRVAHRRADGDGEPHTDRSGHGHLDGISPTATITVTAGPTLSPTVTPTATATPTVTPTATITPTATVTPRQPPIVVQQLHTSGITNTATIDSDQTEPESDEEHNPFPPGIELVDPVIGKSALPPYAQPGQEVTFTLTARNQGIAQAQNVWVTDTVPAFLDAFAATTTKGTVQPIVSNTVVVYIGTLEPYGAEVVTITIRTRVRSGTPDGALINNLATLTADGGDDQDDATVRVPDEDDDDDDDEGPPPPAPTATPIPAALVTPTPTPEILTVAILPETGGHPSLLSAFVRLSVMIGLASLLLLTLPRREDNHSNDEEG
jgi:uncharacterized repeat protein (TIGR01451 family)